ncbi:Cation channel sperm-associated protein 1 [Symbiodinium microadriaticum]|uniref:Cation channel sperm-associated protein 1 n=1 Tax=Symbiodinium microadriaticum TaxID=2951 RepID=A0A1Q9CVV3_SYMMI|nr:Cation channel sperm-associated protein 1 [Symbiodinium microadriaticum]
MPVHESPFSRESSTLPPLVAAALEEEKVPTANAPFIESLQLTDDKFFERLEAWLVRAQEVLDHALVVQKSDRRQVNSKANSTPHDTSRIGQAVLEESRSRHTELKVALSQTKMLDGREGWRETLWTNALVCLHGLSQAVVDCRSDQREVSSAAAVQRCTARLVKSWLFEAFFGTLIVSNSAFIAVQVQSSAEAPGQPLDHSFFIVGSVYTFLFTIELLLRAIAGGFSSFCGPDWAWLVMDTVVVLSSLFEFVVEISLDQEGAHVISNMRILRILRIGRIARAIRIVRLVKFISSLKQLLYSIGQTLRAMVWSVVLLVVIIFLFGLIFTDVVSEHRAQESSAESFLSARFGGLGSSMHSLFASITGGLSWIDARDALADVASIWGFLFEAYIAFCLFAVLNVMTGTRHVWATSGDDCSVVHLGWYLCRVFMNRAVPSPFFTEFSATAPWKAQSPDLRSPQGAEKDHELVLQNVIADKAKYLRAVRRLFSELDQDDNVGVTKAEFEAATNDPSLRAVFDALEINAADAWALFTQLDSDGDNDVSAEEFLEGCMLLKGPARSVDVMSIKRELAAVKQRIDQALRLLGTSSTDMQAFAR